MLISFNKWEADDSSRWTDDTKTRPREKRSGKSKRAKLLFVLIAAALLWPQSTTAQVKQVRRVLIFYDVGLSSPAIELLDQQIRIALEASPFQIELYREYLETSLFPDPVTQQEIRTGYIRKYRDRKPDLIIAIGESPLNFMVAVHEKAFPEVPIVFSGSEDVAGHPKLDHHFTGVWERFDPGKTLEAVVRLLPSTRHVAVVGGTSDFDRGLLALFRKKLSGYEDRFDFTYLTDFDMPTLLQRLKHLPQNTVILYTNIGQDAGGTRYVGASQSGPMTARAANAPIFSPADVYLGYGQVGGYLESFAAEGKLVGEIVLRILNGTRPQDIPIVEGANVYMFDWRALQRWGLKETDLPPGSIVLNRRPTVWESYKAYIIGGIVLILAETLLIFALVWQWESRRRSERYSRALVLRSPVAMLVTRGPDHRNELVNHKFTEIFGYTIEDVPDEAHWWPLAYPDKAYQETIQAEWQEKVERALKQQTDIEPMEASVRCKDGSSRRIEFHFASMGETNLVKFVDLTERQRAEAELRESEARFRLVANSAPVMIWMSGPDKLCNYFNQPWLDFTGRPIEAELGNGWAEMVHPEDFQACLDTYNGAFDRHERFEMQYRLRRHDGEFCWLFDTGLPRFNSDGSFAGYIGSCIDVTDRKQAEEAMADVGRKLIEAHEEERTRIGRELHDDINQRLALVVIELEQWGQERSKSEVKRHEHIAHVKERLSDLGHDIQALSHRLHSSKLDYLGLMVAARSFCRELSEKQKVEIDFTHEGLPDIVPKEISLCLFRILQEALQNAVKYSGVRRFTVRLEGTPAEIHLTISDDGVGFDPHNAFSGQGLGLISMRERIQLVKGEISITSQPARGTTVFARVPVKEEESRTKLAG
jgi:PAS domain S-box-containing protein